MITLLNNRIFIYRMRLIFSFFLLLFFLLATGCNTVDDLQSDSKQNNERRYSLKISRSELTEGSSIEYTDSLYCYVFKMNGDDGVLVAFDVVAMNSDRQQVKDLSFSLAPEIYCICMTDKVVGMDDACTNQVRKNKIGKYYLKEYVSQTYSFPTKEDVFEINNPAANGKFHEYSGMQLVTLDCDRVVEIDLIPTYCELSVSANLDLSMIGIRQEALIKFQVGNVNQNYQLSDKCVQNNQIKPNTYIYPNTRAIKPPAPAGNNLLPGKMRTINNIYNTGITSNYTTVGCPENIVSYENSNKGTYLLVSVQICPMYAVVNNAPVTNYYVTSTTTMYLLYNYNNKQFVTNNGVPEWYDYASAVSKCSSLTGYQMIPYKGYFYIKVRLLDDRFSSSNSYISNRSLIRGTEYKIYMYQISLQSPPITDQEMADPKPDGGDSLKAQITIGNVGLSLKPSTWGTWDVETPL